MWLGNQKNAHSVIFDSHIAFLLKCCILSNNSIVFEGYQDQRRVGSKDDSHNVVILTKPMGQGWCTIITTEFFIGRLSSCIYNRIRVGAKSAKGCNKRNPQKNIWSTWCSINHSSPFLVDVCNFFYKRHLSTPYALCLLQLIYINEFSRQMEGSNF